jgi:UDP-N-acetyl-D-mannosaminouronate:lipid I N-acetyl-D-mannosaminouronosyltransferase
MTEDQRVTLKNGVMVYPFTSFDDVLDFAADKNKLLVAVNAEKILHATDQTRNIINRNIGYCDGIGAVMALKKHGCKNVVKIPG